MKMKKRTMTDFEEKIYELVKKIPAGVVATYGMIAEVLGKRCARAVGNALARNPDSFLTNHADRVPCHRVVRTDGSVGGFMGSRTLKQSLKISLLINEGLDIKNDWIDLDKYLIKKELLFDRKQD